MGVRLVGGVLLEVDGRQRRVGRIAASSGGRGRGSGACELSMGKPLERRGTRAAFSYDAHEWDERGTQTYIDSRSQCI